jgi:hypothetical protein
MLPPLLLQTPPPPPPLLMVMLMVLTPRITALLMLAHRQTSHSTITIARYPCSALPVAANCSFPRTAAKDLCPHPPTRD